jgi:NAD+ synthase
VTDLSWNVLEIDCEAEANDISVKLREIVSRVLRKRGLVVAISGGIDSSVCAALAVKSIGNERVLGLILPEKDSSAESATKARSLADFLGISTLAVDIAPTLDAIGCYRWRDEAVRRAVPEYRDDWGMKIAISGGLSGQVNHFRIVAQSPAGQRIERRLNLTDYLQIVAATNFKQRIRKTLEYFHADRLNFAVVGTPNRLEYDQGFFVKNGDGAADVKPIAHLYKTQVYTMARSLGLPKVVCEAEPTTDTYSLPQGQDEFYFSLPYRSMDLALWAHNDGRSASELAGALDVTEEQASLIFADITAKRRASRYLHQAPLLVKPVDELSGE